MVDVAAHIQAAPQRAGVYDVLGSLLEFPEDDFEPGDALTDLRTHIAGLPYRIDDPADANDIASVHHLKREYMRLFEVPGKTSPCVLYGGMYAGNRQSVMEELLRFYRHFGLSVATAPKRDMPDNLSTVLEFLSYLCMLEGRSPSMRAAEPARAAQRDVLERHLATWIPAMQARLNRQKPVRLYASVFSILDAFSRNEMKHFRSAFWPQRITGV